MNIKTNPSNLLQKEISMGFKDRFPKGSGIELFHSETLDVHSESCQNFVKTIKAEIESHKAKNEGHRYLVIHIGVNSGLKNFELQLESKCYNSSNFKDGNVYVKDSKEAIHKENELDSAICTKLPLEKIKKNLEKNHPHVKISVDPGRYLCNYI